MRLEAIVLAGGRSSRMGAPKSALVFEGRSLVEIAVDSARTRVGRTGTVVVVGPRELAPPGVLTAREEPAWGGPAAALAAGIEALSAEALALRPPDVTPAEWVLVLACDLPRAALAVDALVAAAMPHTGAGVDAVVAVDDSGRRQPLLALYRTDALAGAAASASLIDDLAGLSLRRLLAGLTVVEVAVDGALCVDVDTPEQARAFGIDVPPVSRAAIV
ncbi:molybdenum cofactor guanylyltransferase [Conyzicola sp.]|uniref:molybdenum cofactor guanylyltransferase n=1 Tax=Conyzicola sp. TaxID=1969404 RepID=UPI003989FC4E